ncbi:MAG TPA: GldG family protein [Thermoanaerobaculia bacterium]|nr:GldG family protein [Thermoanaerobaculia bacterium]
MSRARTVRVGTTAFAAFLAAALLLGVNYLSSRHYIRGDWTSTRIFSLSDTTKKIVRGLTRPVRITVFMTRGSRLYTSVNELVNRYRAISGKLEVEFVDPERQMARAEVLVREFGFRQNTVLFRCGEKKKYVEEDKLADYDYTGMGAMGGGQPEIKAFKGEEAFTSAIREVTENRVTRVYFSSGHGEPALDSQERHNGFALAKQLLEHENFTVGSWDSLGKGSVPSDGSVIVVAGPKTAFLEPETSALEKYVAGGGRALVMLDPVLPTRGAPASDLGLGALLANYGVRLGNDIVIDPANAVALVGPETVIANHYGTHEIVRSLSEEKVPVLFPLARSVSKTEKAAAGFTATTLVETTPDGWGETDLNQLDDVKKDAKDNQGPVTIALAVEPAAGPKEKKLQEKPARLVVFGNSRFATNASIVNVGNANLFLNAIHWLAGEEKLIGIAPKTPEQASLSLTQSQLNRLGLLAMGGMPLFAVVLGVWVWYRRRD